MKHFSAIITSHRQLSSDFFELTFEWNTDTPIPMPGQFCTIRVSPFSSPLLRRPFAFSAYDAQKSTASIMYKRRGPATEIITAKETGDTLDIIGPLGSDFISVANNAHFSPVCVAGGTGLGPMLYLCNYVKQQGKDAILVLGCRSKNQIPVQDVFSGLHTIIATDDGSEGIKGTSLDALATLTIDMYNNKTVCVCGPLPLEKGCHEWAQKNGLPCFVSIEHVMACGVGACMGCAVKVTDANNSTGYVRACTEGPVFFSERISWI